jgi:glycosyltransferase involved in cell wall biosynthesis
MALAYAISLKKSGHDVALLYAPIATEKSILSSFADAGVRLKECKGLKFPVGPVSTRAVAKDIIMLGADITISCQVREASIVALASGIANIPNIHFAQNRRNFGGNPVLSRLKHYLYGRSLRSGCHQLIATSEFVREQHVNEFGFPHNLTSVVDNGIDLESIRLGSKDCATARRLIADADDKFVIMQTGRITPQKGQDTLIKAFSGFKLLNDAKGGPEKYILTLVGSPGPSSADKTYFKMIKALIKQLDLQESVRMLGWVDQVTEILPAADLLMHPANWEGGCPPLSVQEAMALAIPVAFSDCAGSPANFRNGIHGMTFRAGSVTECCKALQHLLVDVPRPDLTEIGLSGRKFADIAFDVKKNSARFVETVDITLEAAKKP